MFTTVGWQESKAGTASYAQLAALPDQHVRVSGNLIYVPSLNNLICEHVCGGAIAVGAYFDSPSLRRQNLLDHIPIQKGVNGSGAESFVSHFKSPIPLQQNEGLAALLVESAGGVEIRSAFVLLADAPVLPVDGQIFTIRATAALTTITGEWVNAAITLSQSLPVGTYALVGASVFTATGIAFRFVLVGYQWRPGGLCCNDIGATAPAEQRYGGMGVWGTFTELTPPTIEMIGGTAAAQAPVIYLDIIKVA